MQTITQTAPVTAQTEQTAQPREMCFYQPGTAPLVIVDTIRPDGLSCAFGSTLEEIQAHYPGAAVGDFEECWKAREASFITAPVEIDEERLRYYLEVLPPMDWQRHGTSESFKLSEMTSGNITTICCRMAMDEGERYFELSDRVTLTHWEICEKCRNAATETAATEAK